MLNPPIYDNEDSAARERWIEEHVWNQGMIVDMGYPEYPDGVIIDADGRKRGPLPSFPKVN